ncbi:TPA: hypothetical protein QEL15_001761 [Stenotrophomonas maltophilia]|nr:hypothetical protein [Stenotrophomonas maltophilia]
MMRRLAMAVVSLLAAPLGAAAPPAGEPGSPFAVHGEQVQHAIPAGWTLAWMEGDRSGNGEVLAEYLPPGEPLQAWRGGYLLIHRLPMPDAEVMKQVAASGATLVQVALSQQQDKARGFCAGKFTPTSARSNRFNGVEFAVAGGFCVKVGPAAPFGEGAVVAYLQGNGFIHQVQYGWRPADAAEQRRDLPYRIAPAKVAGYMQAITASTLCGGASQPLCTTKDE